VGGFKRNGKIQNALCVMLVIMLKKSLRNPYLLKFKRVDSPLHRGSERSGAGKSY